MLAKDISEDVYELRTESQRQDGKHQESHETSGEDGQQKMTELHLRNRRREYKQLEWRGRRQHRRKHQAPKRMSLESLVKPLEPLRRDALAQQLFAALVSDRVYDNAAQHRSRR